MSYEIVNFNASVNVPVDQTPIALRESVTEFAETLKAYPQVDLPVQHEFLDGVYMRTVHMAAGTIVVGKIHKQEHVAIISAGYATVLTENGVLHIRAPYIFKSPPGARRALLIHEDMVWTTVHRSDHTDLEQLENQLIATDFSDPILVELEQKVRALK